MTDVLDYCPACEGKDLGQHCTARQCAWMICRDCRTIVDPATGRHSLPGNGTVS